MQSQARRERPVGIVIIAILYFIGGLGELYAGMYRVADIEPILLALPDELEPLFAALVIAAGIGSIALACGLYVGKGWAWPWNNVWVSVVFAWVIAETLLQPSEWWVAAVSIPVGALIMYYMYRPSVRAFFGKSPARGARLS